MSSTADDGGAIENCPCGTPSLSVFAADEVPYRGQPGDASRTAVKPRGCAIAPSRPTPAPGCVRTMVDNDGSARSLVDARKDPYVPSRLGLRCTWHDHMKLMAVESDPGDARWIRQREDKRASLPDSAFSPNAAAMCMNDARRDVRPSPRPRRSPLVT